MSCCQSSPSSPTRAFSHRRQGFPGSSAQRTAWLKLLLQRLQQSGFWSSEIYVRDESATWSFLFVLGFSWTFPDAFSSAVPGCLPPPHHPASPWHKEARPWICTDVGRGVPWTAAVLGLCRLGCGLSAVPLGAFDVTQRTKEWGELKNT